MNDTIIKIAKHIQSKGATAYLVGGCVRDSILGLTPKDFDFEVYGCGFAQLCEFVSELGEISVHGSFLIVVLKCDDDEYEFSVPRHERKNGIGYTGFDISEAPEMSFEESLARRDLTINAILFNPLNGQIIDPFNGANDIKEKVLRPTSERFAEDPLRVLRAMQFASRFGFTISDELAVMARSLTNEFSTISAERLSIEFDKMLTRGISISDGLNALVKMGWGEVFPELANLIGCQQSPIYHPEGDAFTHTLMVADAMLKICIDNRITGERRKMLILAAITHDMGKPATTVLNEKGEWVSPRHAQETQYGRAFVERIYRVSDMQKKCAESDFVHAMTKWHMQSHGVTKNSTMRKISRELASVGAVLEDLIFLMQADISARPFTSVIITNDAIEAFREFNNSTPVQSVQPILMGKHLIEMGMKPSSQFGVILKKALDAQDEGVITDVESGKAWVRDNC